jgi:hypothetical protein
MGKNCASLLADIWGGIHSKPSTRKEKKYYCGLQFDISIYRRCFIY